MSTTLSHQAAVESVSREIAEPTETEHQPLDSLSVNALFTVVEMEQFAADDAAAGQTLGRILSGGFVFTVIAASGVGFWTTWHHGAESIAKFVVIPSIIVVCICIAFGWGKAMIDYGAEHGDHE